MRRLTAAVLTTTFLATALGTAIGTAPAGAADPTYPTGTFTLDRTTAYLRQGTETIPDFADLTITATALGDDTTARADIVVKVLRFGSDPGHTERPVIWANTTGPFELEYNDTGTFHPQLWLTDADHHTTVIDLPAVTVVEDHTPPVVTMVTPKPANRVASWRVLHGTLADAGIGNYVVNLLVLQKRHGRWYYFRSDSRRWFKGKATIAATRKNPNAYSIAGLFSANGPWKLTLVGLTKSPTAVCYSGEDHAYNTTPTRCVSGRITRR